MRALDPLARLSPLDPLHARARGRCGGDRIQCLQHACYCWIIYSAAVVAGSSRTRLSHAAVRVSSGVRESAVRTRQWSAGEPPVARGRAGERRSDALTAEGAAALLVHLTAEGAAALLVHLSVGRESGAACQLGEAQPGAAVSLVRRSGLTWVRLSHLGEALVAWMRLSHLGEARSGAAVTWVRHSGARWSRLHFGRGAVVWSG